MTLYVSWGGSGTIDSLRTAARQAVETDSTLVYLGVVDDLSFGDVDGATMEMLVEELSFLLRTQLVGVARQMGADLQTDVLIRRGDVASAIAAAAAEVGAESALIGGPLATTSTDEDPRAVVSGLGQSCGLELKLI